jgi:hypothetical protein
MIYATRNLFCPSWKQETSTISLLPLSLSFYYYYFLLNFLLKINPVFFELNSISLHSKKPFTLVRWNLNSPESSHSNSALVQCTLEIFKPKNCKPPIFGKQAWLSSWQHDNVNGKSWNQPIVYYPELNSILLNLFLGRLSKPTRSMLKFWISYEKKTKLYGSTYKNFDNKRPTRFC